MGGREGATPTMRIPVIEVFGPTIQGEGMVIGRKTMFVRTAGCDYQCTWCDSAFTWDGSERHRVRPMEPSEVLRELKSIGGTRFNHVTISGGNPALIGQPMKAFVDLCHAEGYQVGLETQGSMWQEWMLDIDDLSISPKPPSSKMVPNLEVLDDIVQRLGAVRKPISLKVVVFDLDDYNFAKRIHQRYAGVTMYLQVGNDRVHDAVKTNVANHLLSRLNWLFEQTIADSDMNDVRVLPQLHALVWGNERER